MLWNAIWTVSKICLTKSGFHGIIITNDVIDVFHFGSQKATPSEAATSEGVIFMFGMAA